MRSRTSALTSAFVLLLLCFSACNDSIPPQQAVPTFTEPGDRAKFTSCKSSDQCASGRCLQVGEDKRVCTVSCEENADCPKAKNWVCDTPREIEEQLCLCLEDGPELCGDGIDNDCNGKVDDCLMCEGRFFPPNNRQNCGACGVSCKVGSSCREGACVCPDGQPETACTTAETPECMTNGHCYDGNDCTIDRCNAGRCVYRLGANPCAAGESCHPISGRCERGDVCAKDSDCDDGDPCTTDERCDPSLRLCVSKPLDGDQDRDAPRVCGGTDCDDDDATTLGGGTELCDDVDNDCDGTKDGLAANADCYADEICVEGMCECKPGLNECTPGACTDVNTDPDHCGSCDSNCAVGQLCIQGTCTCPEGSALCEGACQSPAWFQSQNQNCGECGQACTGGQVCDAGACQCPASLVLCGGVCSDTQTQLNHCGGCDQPCDASFASCAGGQCQCALTTDLVCGGTCVSVTNQLHCGACNTPCALCGVDTCVGAAKLFVGFDANCALLSNGELYCWGKLGNVTNRIATRVETSGGVALIGAVEVVMGWSHACARTSAGQAYCWGTGSDRQLGNGSTSASALAVRVETGAGVALDNIAELSAGRYLSTCARLANGEAYCWGYGGSGLGNGSTVSQSRPVRVETAAGVALTNIAKVYVGLTNYCARLASNELYCWGYNFYGQVGDGSNSNRSRPVRVETAAGVALAGVSDVVIANNHTCARTNGNQVYCWGYNGRGQLGNGSVTDSYRPLRVEVSAGVPLANVAGIAAANDTSCARRTNGEVYCWGENEYGVLGAGLSADSSRPVRAGASLQPPFVASSGPLMAPSNATSIACAQSGIGAPLSCWGYGSEGALGSGLNASSTTPVAVALPEGGVVAYGEGRNHGCALLDSGLVYCWGANNVSQLGTNNVQNNPTPQLVRWPIATP